MPAAPEASPPAAAAPPAGPDRLVHPGLVLHPAQVGLRLRSAVHRHLTHRALDVAVRQGRQWVVGHVAARKRVGGPLRVGLHLDSIVFSAGRKTNFLESGLNPCIRPHLLLQLLHPLDLRQPLLVRFPVNVGSVGLLARDGEAADLAPDRSGLPGGRAQVSSVVIRLQFGKYIVSAAAALAPTGSGCPAAPAGRTNRAAQADRRLDHRPDWENGSIQY